MSTRPSLPAASCPSGAARANTRSPRSSRETQGMGRDITTAPRLDRVRPSFYNAASLRQEPVMRPPFGKASPVLAGLLAVAVASSCKKGVAPAAKQDLALVPKDANLVVMLNLSRARGSAMWKKLVDLRDQSTDG